MNPDKCPTSWDELLRIRAENPNYGKYGYASEEPTGPLRTTPEHPLFSRTPSPVCCMLNLVYNPGGGAPLLKHRLPPPPPPAPPCSVLIHPEQVNQGLWAVGQETRR